MSRAPRWAAVVVNYEAGPLLIDCVRSLLADTSAGPADVVVVDNGSRDGSVDALRSAARRARSSSTRREPRLRGAANRGIAATRAPVVAVCNPDLEVRPGTGRALLARLDAEPDLGAVGPAVRNPDGTRYPSARRPALGRRRRSRLCSRGLAPATASPAATASSTPTRPAPRRRLGVGRDGVPPAHAPSTPSAAGTSATSCTWRTSTCAGGCGGWAGASPTSPQGGAATHVQGASTASRPYRMIVEHHRSAYRFARPPVARGPPAAARSRRPCSWRSAPGRDGGADHGRAPGSAEGQRVTCDSPCPSPAPVPKRRHAVRSTASRSGGGAGPSLVRRHAVVVIVHRRRGPPVVGSRQQRERRTPSPATRRPTSPGDHWHTALSTSTSAAMARPAPQFEKPADSPNQAATPGIHTHGDGLIHTHPFVNAEEGNNATLGKFFSYGGWGRLVRLDRLAGATPPSRRPEVRSEKTTWSNGDTCPFGQVQGQEGRAHLGGRRQGARPATRPTTTCRTARRSRSTSSRRAPTAVPTPLPAPRSPRSPTTQPAILSKNSPCRAATPDDHTTRRPAPPRPRTRPATSTP